MEGTTILPGLTVLTDEECRTLLASHHTGRLAIVVDDAPHVVPVNYVFDGRHIAIRTNAGTKLAGSQMRRATLEIDHIDGAGRIRWSVCAHGFANEVSNALDQISLEIRALPVEPMAPGTKAHWIRIDVDQLTGRRLGP